ncbi:aldehyde ferredoxin oxidoreductase family protein [Desulfurococcus mucosus]|uniref:Tungsten-dependent formaldehyde:ferredoxin oxidoreductase n=1 Tax=Desulfurococcus mucosus (strain ATCC 35584 / DSM 2162 / JCM 9187 / O7/1) TaxID=765177 RepID=E8R700_DESM0|nr:aldehyde ferredoxin oxidoreductase family protein [Desulfurococcus mucosus]ADV64433.1 tungsten-dependent formaldehyde:ferredoxin oxidoreductase [Desulfurococcus mucosus DSM 2162]
MYGWWGKVLLVDLTRMKTREIILDPETYRSYIGGRGLAVRLLWDLVPPGADPLSPYNALVVASGPLSGLPLPSSGKLVVASKSPLTNGYGDGNIGTMASHHLKHSGFDAIVVTGASRKPVYIYVENEKVEVRSAEHLWGLDTFTTEDKLVREHGRNIGILEIGPAGEHMVKYATVISQKGRSGGRPGIGAVMGSKRLKAIVVKGTREPPIADKNSLRSISEEAYRKLLESEGYDYWIRQGTMATIQWSQQNSVLPTMNYREGVWELYETISGDLMEKLKTDRRGCPYCNMQCGNVIADDAGEESELDYENVAMLGSNILLEDLRRVGEVNKMADKLGLDTISLGNAIGFYMEASERGLVRERLEWGDFKAVREIVVDTAYRRGLGAFIAEGVMRMSTSLGGEALDFAMHVKGLEVSAYNCHTTPGMALAYATSSIGAHHKDAWIISYEVKTDRTSYSREKVERLIFLQNIRGGMFESLTTCRLPWVELGLNIEYYPKMLSAVTGLEWSINDMHTVADRIYTLIRAFWIREHSGWSRSMDYPPARWFKHPLTKGPYAGHHLDPLRYEKMLEAYYEMRGWNENGIPRRETLLKLGLDFTIPILEKIVELG